MLKESKKVEIAHCPQCHRIESITYTVEAMGLSKPIAIMDGRGSYTITWILGNDAPPAYVGCTCRQEKSDIRGEMELGKGGKHPMNAGSAMRALSYLEEERFQGWHFDTRPETHAHESEGRMVTETYVVDRHGNMFPIPDEPLSTLPDKQVDLEQIRTIVREEVHKALAEEVRKLRMYGGRNE